MTLKRRRIMPVYYFFPLSFPFRYWSLSLSLSLSLTLSLSSTFMGSLKFQFTEMGLYQKPQIYKPQLYSRLVSSGSRLKITCGLRDGPRKPMWRSRVLSTEAIQAVQSLKLAKSSVRLEEVFSSRVSRLLKADLLDTLTELRRQNELDLTLKVFEFVRKEVWYEPNLSLFSDMILMVGKNQMIEMAEDIFSELKKEGLEPDTRAYTEMIGAYLQVGMIQKAMKTYDLMKASGCVPDKLTLTILIRNLEKAGEEELAALVKKECAKYVDSPEKFLEEVEKKYVRNPILYVSQTFISLCLLHIFPNSQTNYSMHVQLVSEGKALIFSDCPCYFIL
ncbi:hypothetical protein F0562_034637 [Nyssa sinensis]|uniref:Pentacotripeptide-repeat region of PRORP domain-containing protein n=1 Tax=Nyssa sinensis TaxID=561372 RepID=A0A5J5ABZ0_9ASTE|nr:hypothetical protein F0562_034637 [Nyssa sinensis]